MDCLQFAAYGKICGKLDSTWMWAVGGVGQKCAHGRGLWRPNNHIEEKGALESAIICLQMPQINCIYPVWPSKNIIVAHFEYDETEGEARQANGVCGSAIAKDC